MLAAPAREGMIAAGIAVQGDVLVALEPVLDLGLRLGREDLAELDRAFPPPRGKRPLETV